MNYFWIYFELFRFILCYKPVILVHGVLSDGGELEYLKDQIIQAHPGTNVTILKYVEDLDTLERLPFQLPIFQESVKSIMKKSEEGAHLICHSQGGLLCHGFLEYCSDHLIHTFIALSTPIFGQYGISSAVTKDIPLLKPFQNLTREVLSPLFYSTVFQTLLSIPNYWKDPRTEWQNDYEQHSIYLVVTLNDPSSKRYNSSEAKQRRKNFLRLKKLVLIGGPDDGVITPWQSALFGYYDNDPDSKNIIDMKHQKVFTEDWFGLRSLYTRGGVSSYVFRGVHHTQWHHNKTVFRNAIEKWLI